MSKTRKQFSCRALSDSIVPIHGANVSGRLCCFRAKVKKPLRGTRYNTRDELIRAIERSIRNINKDGRYYFRSNRCK